MSVPLITMFHQSQLPATPCAATRPVTTSGVSAAKVVAIIAAPASHHGTARPGDEVLVERLAALLREPDPDADREDEVGDDDGPVEGERVMRGC